MPLVAIARRGCAAAPAARFAEETFSWTEDHLVADRLKAQSRAGGRVVGIIILSLPGKFDRQLDGGSPRPL